MLAYTFAWIPWIVCVKLHASEMMLNIGTAGPAVAALIQLRHRRTAFVRFGAGRILLFLLTIAGCSAILSLYYAGRGGSSLHFRWDPWSLLPSIAPAWILSSALSPDRGVRDLSTSLIRFSPWSLVALSIFPGIVIVGDAVANRLHQPLVVPAGSGTFNSAAAVVSFLYNIFFVAALEESGWRGCLLPLLQKRWSPLRSTLVVWLAWALWHAPLDLSRPTPFTVVQYLEIRVIFLIPIAVILTWLYNRSSGSVQACAIFHASMNTIPFVVPYWMPSFALLFVIAGAAVVAGRMWRIRRFVLH